MQSPSVWPAEPTVGQDSEPITGCARGGGGGGGGGSTTAGIWISGDMPSGARAHAGGCVRTGKDEGATYGSGAGSRGKLNAMWVGGGACPICQQALSPGARTGGAAGGGGGAGRCLIDLACSAEQVSAVVIAPRQVFCTSWKPSKPGGGSTKLAASMRSSTTEGFQSCALAQCGGTSPPTHALPGDSLELPAEVLLDRALPSPGAAA